MFLRKLQVALKFRNLRLFSSVQSESAGPISYEKLEGSEGRIALYGLNRPENRNALSHDFVKNMREVNEILRSDTKVSVVIIHSLVPGIFCAGANLKERFKMNEDEVKNFVQHLRGTFTEIEDLPMATVAAIDGLALGGGLELALACDIRVVSDNAKLGLVETSRGILPGAGGTQRLPRLIQPNIAKELIFTSRIVTGEEAHKLGIANHCVPQNNNKNAAYNKALEIAKEISINAPVALRCAKQAINEGIDLPVKEGCNIEQKWYEVNIPTKDRIEGMVSFFEKRKAVFRGH